jgi:hypothetical protein
MIDAAAETGRRSFTSYNILKPAFALFLGNNFVN